MYHGGGCGDLLVEQVDHESALDGVAVEVAQVADLDVTERDAGEVARDAPGTPTHQVNQHLGRGPS